MDVSNEIAVFERLSALETLATNLDHRLYGNGSPGDIAEIKTKLDRLAPGDFAELKTQVERITSWYWKLVGGLAVVGFLIAPAIELAKYLLPPRH